MIGKFSRDKTLWPVDNWYSAIMERSIKDEVVLLHGDDDIFCPWSLEDRYEAVQSTRADMLMSYAVSRIVFLPDKVSAVMGAVTISKRQIEVHPSAVEWEEIDEWGPAFIGNHCYRRTEKWEHALSLSYAWCHQQDWLDWNTRTLMLPYYLPYAVKECGGSLCGIKEVCVIRGGTLEEMVDSEYGSPSWNSGFLALCAYEVLMKHVVTVHPKAWPACHKQLLLAARWFFTFYFDSRISTETRRKTLKRIGLPLNAEILFQMLLGLRLLVGEISGLRGWEWKRQARRGVRSVSKIIADLAEVGPSSTVS